MTTKTAVDSYTTLSHTLADLFALDRDRIDVEPATGAALEIHVREFLSQNWRVHPAESEDNTDPAFRKVVGDYIERLPYSERNFFGRLQPSDRDVPENLRFRYPVFVPRNGRPARGFDRATVLLHGLNEKSWQKYLPWAHRLAEQTARPVILFPLAFHMNRAPRAWSNPREMIGVSHERKRLFPEIRESSFVNAALSHRIQFAPHRFLTSGLQSYYDITDMVRDIRGGGSDLFAEGARVDVFGYSIGATLTELLLLSDPAGLFEDSRAFLFCGGAVMDRTLPVSKAIIDSAAYDGMVSFFERLMGDAGQALPRSVEVIRAGRWEVEVAKSLLFTDRLRPLRERAMRAVGNRMIALGMMKDRVFPPSGIAESCQTTGGEELIQTAAADPSYDYTHECPFPLDTADHDEVERFFGEVMARAVEHLQ